MRYSCQTTMFGVGVLRHRASGVQAEDHHGRLPPSRFALAGLFTGQSL
jgi:hypothetical protein